MAGIVVQRNLLYDFLCCMHFGFMNNIYLSYIFSQTNNGDKSVVPHRYNINLHSRLTHKGCTSLG